MVIDSDDEKSRIKDNLAVVRTYLTDHFPHYTITEISVLNPDELHHIEHELLQYYLFKVAQKFPQSHPGSIH